MFSRKVTKFEKTHVVGVRAEQISLGAEPKVDVRGLEDPIEMALREYEAGKIPYIIVREYPDHQERVKLYKTNTE